MKIKEIKIVNQDESTEIADIGADAQNVDYNDTTVKDELDKLNVTNNSLINEQTNLQSQVSSLASGSPAGVYATVAALTSADPDHSKIYVVTANGNWYYYNGTTWVSGGVYQSTGIAEKSIQTGYFSDLIREKTLIMENALERLQYTKQNGYYGATAQTIAYHENSQFIAYDVSVSAGQKLNLKTFLSNNTIYALILLNNDTVISRLFYGTEDIFPTDYNFIVPSNVNRIICNYKKNSTYPFELSIEAFINTIQIKNDVTTLKNKFIIYDYIDITEDINIEEGKFYNYSTHVYNTYSNGSHTDLIECVEGDKFKVTSSIIDSMCLAVFFDENETFVDYYLQNYGTTNVEDELVTIPANTKYVIFQCKVDKLNSFKIKKYMSVDIDLNEMLEVEKENSNNIEILQSGLDDSNFEIENLQRRCLENEKLVNFEWGNFDKAYFAFVIDDCNSFTPTCTDTFHSLEVPLSSACIVDRLQTIYSSASGRTIKQVLQAMVSDGGEVLAHYSGNLADPGYSNGNYTYLTSDEDWKIRTRDVKKKLEEEGFIVRGLIKADSSQTHSNKGEEICRKYFDYSDEMGKSSQFSLGKRKFFIGVNTLNEMKAYIDTCCQTPGFYPFCLHGNRQDEPLATVENLTEIVNYIKNKGNNIAEITTYSNVFDKFKTTTIEKRLDALENSLL